MPHDGSPRHNLPSQPNPFVGRESELAALTTLLRQPSTRVMTLLGPGGTGKTRLSLRLGELCLDTYSDGVWFIELEPVTDPDLVIPILAHTLGLQEDGSQPIADMLHVFIQDKHMLLIFDNVEQVVGAAEQIAEIVREAQGVQIISTSRVALKIPHEILFELFPFPIPDPHELPALDELAQNPAVAIFMQRACLVKPDFRLTIDNAAKIVPICARLDGLPLAIELAASRIRQFPPETLLPALDNSLDLLTKGGRDRSERQQTLRGLIAWSYDLLSVGEQMLFSRLAVFAGGWTLAAAEAVCNIDDDLPIPVADGLAALVEQSLLRMEMYGETEPREVRYTMLNTIRDYAHYALERLAPEGEITRIEQQYAAYYVALAEEAETHLRGPEGSWWCDRLERDHDNLRLVLAVGSAESAARIAVALTRFWLTRGYWTEGRHQAERLLTHSLPDVLRAKILFTQGFFAFHQGDHSTARPILEQSLTLAREYEDWDTQGNALNFLAAIATIDQRRVEAVRLFAESAACYRASGNAAGLSDVLGNRVLLYVQAGNYAEAEPELRQVLALDRTRGDAPSQAWDLNMLSWVLLILGDSRGARLNAVEGLQVSQAIGDQHQISNLLQILGIIDLFMGETDVAQAQLMESLHMYVALGEKEGISLCLAGLAGVYAVTNKPEQAAQLFGAFDALHATLGLSLLNAHLPVYERLVALARPQLDKSQWAANHTLGGQMTLEEAIAFANG